MEVSEEPALHPWRRVIVSGMVGALSIASLVAGEKLEIQWLEVTGFGLFALDVALGYISHLDSFRHWGENLNSRAGNGQSRK